MNFFRSISSVDIATMLAGALGNCRRFWVCTGFQVLGLISGAGVPKSLEGCLLK